jgi:hypothetical protein
MAVMRSICGKLQSKRHNPPMRFRRFVIAAMLLGILVPSCTIALPNPLTAGASFIVKGTFEVRQEFGRGDCPVWVADTGILYHLFQGTGIANADFDRITTPGVTSRLRIASRSDLVVACQIGTSVVVDEVLQILP